MMGQLPRRDTSDNCSKSVDMWALGCAVHETLTGQIPFRKTEYEQNGITEFDFGTQVGDMEMRTGIGTLKSFCDGETDFPSGLLTQSTVSEEASEIGKEFLVANPESRLAAKEALGSAW